MKNLWEVLDDEQAKMVSHLPLFLLLLFVATTLPLCKEHPMCYVIDYHLGFGQRRVTVTKVVDYLFLLNVPRRMNVVVKEGVFVDLGPIFQGLRFCCRRENLS